MITGKIREQGNSYVVTIPREAMEEYHLKKGDTIVFSPILTEQRIVLGEDVQRALDEVIREDQYVLDLLAQ